MNQPEYREACRKWHDAHPNGEKKLIGMEDTMKAPSCNHTRRSGNFCADCGAKIVKDAAPSPKRTIKREDAYLAWAIVFAIFFVIGLLSRMVM